MPHYFVEAYRRNVDNLAPIVGAEAGQLTVRSNNWLAVGYLLGILLFVPLAVWAQLSAPPVVWLPAGISGVSAAMALMRGARLGVKSGHVASDFVSDQLGLRVQLRGGGWRPKVWERRIERARLRRAPD
jgi:hypothetical protein